MSDLDALALTIAAADRAGGRPVEEVAVELATQAGQVAALLTRFDGCARWVATVEAVDYEATSTRAIVTVQPSRPDAEPERLRTDRTDTRWGLVVARRAKRLIGHRVLVHKQLEEAGADKRVRVLVWLDPLDPPAATQET